jgi:hypothetical protein
MKQVFHHLNKNTNICVYIYIYVNTYFIAALRGRKKKRRDKKGKRKCDRADDPKLRARRPPRNSVLRTGARG